MHAYSNGFGGFDLHTKQSSGERNPEVDRERAPRAVDAS
jgi:hypothetical protein